MEHFGQTIVSALAVGGAGAMGYFLTMGIIWLAGRFTVQKQPPKPVTRIVSALGAVALGLVTAMLLFNNGGGGGWGLGGGLGLGKGPGDSKGIDDISSKAAAPSSPADKTPPDPTTNAPPLRIRLLGGVKVKDARFYQLESDQSTYDFAGIKNVIKERQRTESAKPLREVVIVIDDDSVARDHAAVQRLESYVKDQGLFRAIQDLTKK